MRPAGRGSPLAWLGGLLALYLSLPIVAFVVRLVGSNDRGFGAEGLWGALRTSVITATISTLIVAVCGVPLAHWLARSSSPLARVVGVLVPLPLALPPVMSGIILIYVVGPYTAVGSFFDGDLTDSMVGIVLAQTFVAAPFLIIAARSAFASVDPALEDLAATLGHRSLARFRRVSLPLAASGIQAGMLLTWMRALGEYGATVLLAYHPFSLPVYTSYRFSGTGLPDTQAPTALALAVAAAALIATRLRWPNALRRPVRLPEARHPEQTKPTRVSFDIDTMVGSFHLRVAHEARSHRIAILGPSGSGKSITLRTLAGLLGAHVGTVRYGDELVTDVPTESRRIGYVPQGLGLFPDRTVWQQLCFGVDADVQRAAWWLQTLQLDGLADRRPHQLSGGQRQRVGLAQALAHNPRLVLLDEPFSALDAPVREELRRELRRLQRETGLSTVLVTHDPEEAALLADEILVIDEGRLLQAGPRSEVYNRPASPEVARLLGIQNLTPATVSRPGTITAGRLEIETGTDGIVAGSRVLWCIRPDHIAIRADGDYPATVIDVADIGTLTSVTVELAGGPQLRIRTTEAIDVQIGEQCRVDLDPDSITLWPAEHTRPSTPLTDEGEDGAMRTVAEHQKVVAELLPSPAPVEVPLAEAAGRVLAEDVVATIALPNFDNSAMDGYAVRAEDIRAAGDPDPVLLPVEADIPAGRVDTPPLRPGTAHRIMTGAPMPRGADAVVQVEATDGGTSEVSIREPRAAGTDVRYAGEDVQVGDQVLTAGTVLRAAHLGLLAALGASTVRVRPPLRVLVLSTGSELVEPGKPLRPGQIYESNATMIAAAVDAAGARAEHLHFVADDVEAFRAALEPALGRADLLITSGGVSAGAYEVVKDALTGQGVEFVRVAMQPGKPQGAGQYKDVAVVTMPGNPVSALVSFEVFVRPALRAAMGYPDAFRPVVNARLDTALDAPPGKRQFRRGILDAEAGTVTPVGPPGSHFLRWLAAANCLIDIDEQTTHLDAGTEISVWPLD